VAEQHLAALPVTSRDGRLLGAITIDAAMAEIAPAAWRDQAPRVFS
jgi:Mg/Co/Ni transporter MgtE